MGALYMFTEQQQFKLFIYVNFQEKNHLFEF